MEAANAQPDTMSQFQFTASMMENPLCLPVVTIQPSFSEIIQEVYDGIVPSEKFWVSCYKNSQPSVHAKVNVELDEIDRNLVLTRTVDGDVEVTRNLQGVSESFCMKFLSHKWLQGLFCRMSITGNISNKNRYTCTGISRGREG